MSWEDAPAILRQLRTQLLACDAWKGAEDDVHYPKATNLSDEPRPYAVLADLGRSPQVYAAGAHALQGGTLQVLLYAYDTVGYVEELGRTILAELLAQQTGIPFTGGEVGLSTEPSPAKVAGGANVASIAITLTWGLSP